MTRSWIIDRSNSAKTPIIWNIASPDGVVVLIPCWMQVQVYTLAWNSCKMPTRSIRDRPSRSTLQVVDHIKLLAGDGL